MNPGGALPIVSRWLVVALALDLAFTRLGLRLAIFLPKSPAVADVVSVAARLGAAVENLVPLVGLVALGPLLIEAGRRVGGAWRWGLVLTLGVALGGLASRALPPSPVVGAALAGLTAAAVVLLALPALRASARDGSAVAVVLLGGAVALPALTGLAADVAAGLGESGAPALGLWPTTVGSLAFVGGVLLASVVGLRGALRGGDPRALDRRWLAAAVVTGGLLTLVAMPASQTFGLLLMWGVGLPVLFAAPVYGLVVALAIAGLRGLWLRRPDLAVGIATCGLAGYGLASSGLVVAGLVGLALASGTWVARRDVRAAERREVVLAASG